MKKKYCFLVDTSADIGVKKLGDNVHVMPIGIIATSKDGQEKIYADWVDITREQLFELFAQGYDMKTSQPSIGYMETKMEELLTEYEQIYCLPISKNLSGTYSTACSVKKDLEKKHGKNRILVVDTRGLSIIINEYIVKINALIKQGYTLDGIEKEIRDYYKNFSGFTCVTNVTQLIKGGRLTGIKGLLVKALGLKLVIKLEDGKLEFADKSTNLNNALDKGVNICKKTLNIPKNKVKSIGFFSDLSKTETDNYLKYIKELCKDIYTGDIYVSHFPATIATHLGINSVSVIVEIE